MGKRGASTRSPLEGQNGFQNATESRSKSGITCLTCGKVFKHEHKMKVHVRSHTGETPYECPHCEKSFAQNAALKVHIRTHTGERPYGCEKCGKRFARADHLRQHDRTHTGEKPYECYICGKAFATWSAISRHKSEHLSRDNFSCSVCHKTFARSENLRIHVSKAHKELITVKSPTKTEADQEGCEELSNFFEILEKQAVPQAEQGTSHYVNVKEEVLEEPHDEDLFQPHFLANVLTTHDSEILQHKETQS